MPDEFSQYRFNAIDGEIKDIYLATHKMADQISSIVNQLKLNDLNLESVVNHSEFIAGRLTILEEEKQERIIRWKIYKSLLYFYPLVIVVLVLMTSFDHQKLLEVLSEIKLLLPTG